ncbi:CBASS cGAMP-activated phospholipase [Paludisphaera soli]|uniref:CBASS cGAMP-activated phospholipase n=1 Tax=Paludisphaera soli TaxID=2712865 RepID=UPI0013EA53B3|nr:CBASS cGAMP-activated phospholipase [Paludisphaera soli]
MSGTNEAHPLVETQGSQRRRCFRILSLDGGGIRGAFTAAFLEGLETRLGRPIATSFDLIAGTSTGGIIAVALAMGLSAGDVVRMYQEHGNAIFTRRRRSRMRWAMDFLPNAFLRKAGLDRDALWRSKYDAAALAHAVDTVLEGKTLEKAQHRLIVPSVRTSLGRPIVFRTPHVPNQDRDRHLSARDVILATTAAPTYFPPHWISDPHAEGQFVDGGLWANHPGMLAYVEAIRISQVCRRPEDVPFTPDDILVLSIGTGESPSAFRLPESKAGVLSWAPHLLELMMTSQSQGTHRMLRYLLPDGRYHRINFAHCGAGWELDAVGNLGILIANGRSESRNMIGQIPAQFLDGVAPPYVSFPPPASPAGLPSAGVLNRPATAADPASEAGYES